MRRFAYLLPALLLCGCIAYYQDASRQTYDDIVDTFEKLMAQLDAEAAACETKACRDDVDARRKRAEKLGLDADALAKGNNTFDPDEYDRIFAQVGALKSAWDSRAEILLEDLRGIRAATHFLLELDRRLLDESDLLPWAHVETLVAQREAAAQTLIVLKGDVHAEIDNFVEAMSTALSALDSNTGLYLEGDQGLDIQSALVHVGADFRGILGMHIYTGLDASKQDEQSIRAQRQYLAGTAEFTGMLGYLDRIESSIKDVSTGLANAETALAGLFGEAGDRYRKLDAILRELEQMQAQSEANCRCSPQSEANCLSVQ